LILASLVSIAPAQDFERYAPKLPGETGVVDPNEEKKQGTIRKEGEPEVETRPGAEPARAVTTERPGTTPKIRVERLEPEGPSAFEDVKPVVPGEPTISGSDSAFAEVAPRIPDMPEEYLAAIEQAIQPYLDEVLIDSLKGLVFVDTPEKVDIAGVSVGGVVAPALPDLQKEQFKTLAAKYIGQPVTLRTLNELNKDVVAYYNENDYPVVDVIVPEQDITTGTVQLVVLQGRRGDIRVEGNRFFADNLLANQVRTEEGRILRAKRLMADLNWLNRNPFRRVNLVYTRGDQVGETDLILQVQDRFPVRFYTGYENSGNDATGDNRFFVGFNWGNAFFQDHQMNYQFTTNNDPDLFQAHTGSYMIPLPWRHLLTAYASAGTSDSNTFQAGLLKSTGDSVTAGVRYTVPLPEIGTYQHEISGGFEYKHTNTTLDFAGTTVLDNTTEVDQFLLAYTSGWRDALGSTSFTGTLFASPGDMTSQNTDEAFQQIRAQAEADYVYTRFTLERVQQLPYNTSLVGRVTAQFADGNLLASEQLGVGGYATVRGYEEREANGDNGFFTTFELRSPPISFGNIFGWKDFPGDQAQFLVFWDYADVSPSETLPGQDENVILSSFGPGFRYAINPYMTFRFDYGFQLVDSGQPSRFGSRAHLGLVLSY
jgi:hemolysin activation/secretion protein